MKLKEISDNQKPSSSEGSPSQGIDNGDLLAKLAEEQRKNDEIKRQ